MDKIADICSYDQLHRGMQNIYHDLYRLGITGVHSCDAFDKHRLFQQMNVNDDLKIRICIHPPAGDADKLIAAGIQSGSGDTWLRVGGLKYFMDGSLGSQTADMFDNYDGLDHSGICVLSESDFYTMAQRAAENGLAATVHAIGDQANHHVLNIIENISGVNTPVHLRHRIEHSQILRREDLSRFAKNNIIASMQPLHIADDVRIAEKYLGKRSRFTYPVNSLLKSGCRVVFGSDMPVADPDPLKGIRAAVGRQYKLDRTEPVWQPQESIRVTDAIHAYTRDAAFASYEESIKGTLEPGKLADFIVFDHDIINADEDQLEQVRVMMTVLDGTAVYREF